MQYIPVQFTRRACPPTWRILAVVIADVDVAATGLTEFPYSFKAEKQPGTNCLRIRQSVNPQARCTRTF